MQTDVVIVGAEFPALERPAICNQSVLKNLYDPRISWQDGHWIYFNIQIRSDSDMHTLGFNFKP